jgi:hypothetical protein
MIVWIIVWTIVWILGIAVALIVLMTLGLVLFTAWTAHQVETKMPPRGKFIDIDGVRLHYIDKGSGPPLVLIHGLAGQVLNFTHSLLGRLSHDFRVIILDRPGSGYSLRPDETLAPLTAQARIIGRFCQALGLERPGDRRAFARRRGCARAWSRLSRAGRRSGVDRPCDAPAGECAAALRRPCRRLAAHAAPDRVDSGDTLGDRQSRARAPHPSRRR